MNILEDILKDLNEFIDYFTMKYKYENRGIIKKFRVKSGLNKQMNEEQWCKCFTIKSAINYCCKFILIKFYEDNKRILPKLNNEGFNNWTDMVVDVNSQYNNLYNIALKDILTITEMKKAFKGSDYDIFKIDNELASFMINRLIKYDFSKLDIVTLQNIVSRLYSDYDNINYFYRPSPAVEYIRNTTEIRESLI